MFRTAKKTARFSTTAKIPEIQQTVFILAMKVIDRLYGGQAMVVKRRAACYVKTQIKNEPF